MENNGNVYAGLIFNSRFEAMIACAEDWLTGGSDISHEEMQGHIDTLDLSEAIEEMAGEGWQWPGEPEEEEKRDAFGVLFDRWQAIIDEA